MTKSTGKTQNDLLSNEDRRDRLSSKEKELDGQMMWQPNQVEGTITKVSYDPAIPWKPAPPEDTKEVPNTETSSSGETDPPHQQSTNDLSIDGNQGFSDAVDNIIPMQ